MRNKEAIAGIPFSRPCFYSFVDKDTGLFWLVPISSKVDKYKNTYQDKVSKYGKCDTICFGYVMGKERAFLIQNMCPVSEKYIVDEYINPYDNLPVIIDERKEREIKERVKSVLSFVRRGHKFLVFPDILRIEAELLKENK